MQSMYIVYVCVCTCTYSVVCFSLTVSFVIIVIIFTIIYLTCHLHTLHYCLPILLAPSL